WTPGPGGPTYREGSLLAAPVNDLLAGKPRLQVLFEPSARVSLADVEGTRDHVVLQTLDNVKSRLTALSLEGDAWKRSEIPTPGRGGAALSDANGLSQYMNDWSSNWFFTYQDFTTPESLWLSENGGKPERVKSMPAFFEATGMTTEQYEATSKDGTKIPYFVVRPKGVKDDGTTPTLLHGYGGVGSPPRPGYHRPRG